MKIKVTESEARQMCSCVGCGKQKDGGMIVCWDCFKHRENAFKWYKGTFDQWQMEMRAVRS